MLDIETLPVGPLQTNCYLVSSRDTKTGVVIDPGWSGDRIYKLATEKGIDIKAILITHSHFDHVGGIAEFKKLCNVPLFAHPAAIEGVASAHVHSLAFGILIDPVPEPDSLIEEGQIIPVGDIQFEILYTPGHAPGHVCYYAPMENVLFDGDVLFSNGIGRFDLPGGNLKQLMDSIQNKLMTLPDETTVYPGHGSSTTIGIERQTNQYLLNPL